MPVSVVLVFRTELLNRYEEGPQLAGVIYLRRISDSKSTGTTERNFRISREISGDTTLKNVVLVTNMWGKGAHTARHHDAIQSAHDVIRRILVKHHVALQIQRGPVDEPKYGIVNTVAGGAIDQEFDEQIRQHWTGLKGSREETQALSEKDEETKKEPHEERRKFREWAGKFRKGSEGVTANYTAEKERMEARLFEVEWEVRRERQRVDARLTTLDRRLQDTTNLSAADRARSEQEAKGRDRAEAEHKQQLANLTRHLRDETNASAAHRARLEQEMKELGDRVATAVTMPPYPVLYAQVIFCLAIHGG